MMSMLGAKSAHNKFYSLKGFFISRYCGSHSICRQMSRLYWERRGSEKSQILYPVMPSLSLKPSVIL